MILLDCTIDILTMWENENLQGSEAQKSTLVYTLHWGNTQVEVV